MPGMVPGLPAVTRREVLRISEPLRLGVIVAPGLR